MIETKFVEPTNELNKNVMKNRNNILGEDSKKIIIINKFFFKMGS